MVWLLNGEKCLRICSDILTNSAFSYIHFLDTASTKVQKLPISHINEPSRGDPCEYMHHWNLQTQR